MDFEIDLCWVASASWSDLKHGFPNYYWVVYVANLFLDFGIILLSGLILLKYTGGMMKQNLGLMVFSALLALVFAEIGLRVIGWKPGQYQYYQWVTPVDSLFLKNGFTTGQNGLLKVDTAVVNHTRRIYHEYTNSVYQRRDGFEDALIVGEVIRLIENHLDWDSLEYFDNEFKQRIESVLELDSLSRLDSVLLQYKSYPINDFGLYSIPFSKESFGQAKILLLGDSFTWGHSTSNKTGSFSNILLSRGYTVYNAGITATDVAQYKRSLEVYFDSILPDVVIVNFFMGNDITYYERIPKSGIPVHYSTNAGNILSFQRGAEFLTAKDAYDNVIRNMTIPNTTSLNKTMAQSVVTTLFWQGLVKLNLVEHEYFLPPDGYDTPYSDVELEAMFRFCKDKKVPMILSVIPKLEEGEFHNASTIEGLFGTMPYYEPIMELSHYNAGDGHFNDEGHLFYANYLEQLIQEYLKPEVVKDAD
jgi:hypothetical protein